MNNQHDNPMSGQVFGQTSSAKDNEQFWRLISVIAIIVCLILLSWVGAKAITEGSYGGVNGMLALAGCIVFVVPLLRKPVWGLYVLPFASLVFPNNTLIAGMPFLSPGLVVSAVTLASAVFGRMFHRRKVFFSFVFLILCVMVFFHVFEFDRSPAFFVGRLVQFIQGVIPYFLFAMMVRTEKQGRTIIVAWVLAYAMYSLLTAFSVGFVGEENGFFSFRAAARLRTAEFAGNPNIIGWIGLLCIPVLISLALSAKKRAFKFLYWAAFASTMLVTTLVFSRAAMIGTVLTFLIIGGFMLQGSIFAGVRIRGGRILVVICMGIALFGLVRISQMAVEEKYIADKTALNEEKLAPEVDKRWNMAADGWLVVFANPLRGIGFEHTISTHSYFAKVALEFGLFYLVLAILPFFLVLQKSFIMMHKAPREETRFMAFGIFVACCVAIPEAQFGMTLVGAGYAQFFYLYAAYLEVAEREQKQNLVGLGESG